jgi:DNA-binding beta-propeller fold protein YncE/Tol biopolymer transport system component
MGALRRLAVASVVSLCVLVGGLVFGSVGALAAFTYPFDGQLAPAGGSFVHLKASSVAVDDFNGDAYVADSGTGGVDVFDPSGAQLASLDGSLTPAGSFGGEEVAVAANDGTGRVYVLDPVHDVIDAFEPSGSYACQITGSSSPSASECNGVAGSATPAGGFSEPHGIAVDQATGDVYVVDANNGVVDVFSGGGAYLRQILLSAIPGGFSTETRGIAVNDFNGHVYVAGIFGGGVYEFDAAGAYVTTWSGSNTPAGSFGGGYPSVAADGATGKVYISDDEHNVTDVFDASGAYIARISHFFASPRGTAVDQASGRVYVGNETSVVDILGPALVIPDVTTGSAANVLPTGATLSGTVNPDGVQLNGCHFDYGTSTAYGLSAPCVPAAAAIPADSSVHAVSADVTGLLPGTVYHFRLVASDANGANEEAQDVTFETLPRPVVEGEAATNLTASTVDLSARINPKGLDSTYHFEYGTSTAYGTVLPLPDADIGSGTGTVAVSQHIAGLSANTTYHWRVLATSANGTTTTGDHTFVYAPGGGGLPDNRAYEMVTPPRKNGALIGDAPVFGLWPVVAADGSRVIAPSVQCFAGAASCTALHGNSLGSPYEFSRTSAGWVTTALASPVTPADVSSTVGFDADTGAVLFLRPTPPAGGYDWYEQRADGSFVDIGSLAPPSKGKSGEGGVVLRTADFSHVVWTNTPDEFWPFDATLPGVPGFPPQSVYEYVGAGNAQPLLVGVSGGRGSTDLISACGTELSENGEALSADGRTVYFIADGQDRPGCGGTASPPADVLYARVDESRSVAVSAGAPEPVCGAVCQGSPAGDAWFYGASDDGSKAFFASTQQLVDTASEDNQGGDTARGATGCASTRNVNGCNLYEYDFANPAGRELVDVSAGDGSGGGPRVRGVVAVSADGSHVYFVAGGVLDGSVNAVGQVARSGADNLYVFERDAAFPNGRVTFIAALPASDEPTWTSLEGLANVTPDGRFLVFPSHARLTPDDSSVSGALQVFRYDAQGGVLVRVSVGEDGFNDNGNRSMPTPCTPNSCWEDVHIVSPSRALGVRRDPSMSDDGSRVFFESPVALTPRALDDVPLGSVDNEGNLVYAENVYEWEGGHVYLISDGRDASKNLGRAGSCGSRFSSVCLLGVDAMGANVFFTTADSLVPQDSDTELDIYDARVCTTGDPCIQVPALPRECEGEGCHGTPAGAPAAPVGATVTFAGPGNLTAPLPGSKRPAVKKAKKKVVVGCAKGKRSRSGRCVKVKRNKSGKAHRAKSIHGGKK